MENIITKLFAKKNKLQYNESRSDFEIKVICDNAKDIPEALGITKERAFEIYKYAINHLEKCDNKVEAYAHASKIAKHQNELAFAIGALEFYLCQNQKPSIEGLLKKMFGA